MERRKINIDGRAVTWKVDGQKESLPLYDQDGKTSHNLDAGESTKYVLEKNFLEGIKEYSCTFTTADFLRNSIEKTILHYPAG